MQYGPARPRPASNLELYSWFFMRISATLLFFMAGFHLSYMHVIVGVDAVTFDFVSQRWGSPFWRLYDLVMLLLGWLHCSNGVRIVLDDYIHSPGWRVLAKSALYVFVVIILILGSFVVLTFKPL